MTANGGNGARRGLSVGIVGGGFGGIGMGIRLAREGMRDFTIFERGETVGGVWRANTYPGATCDVPSHLYSFSYAPGHKWSRRYAPQPEILEYLHDCVDDYGLAPHLQLNTAVESATFDAESGRWTVVTDGGSEHVFDLLVTACGQLTNPDVPDIPGASSFGGPMFHSAAWDHDVDLAGKKVAVIGTGASAIQFVPEIAREVGELTIYQRSAPWILPKTDREYPEWERRFFERFPLRVAAARLGMFSIFEALTYGFTGSDWMLGPAKAAADAERRKHLGHDPELMRKATPDYRIGCKRVLVTNEWYPALVRDNVELVDGGVQKITKTGVKDADGKRRPADVIIWGTGFKSHDFVAPMDIHGLDGAELGEVWGQRAEAYLGTTVSGFPNMFILYGPNTNHGSGSVPYTLECQYNYIADAARRIREQELRWIDLRPETQAEWRREMEERSASSIWSTGGCANWYVTEDGINTNNWPGPWLEYRRRTKKINPGHYRAAVLSGAEVPTAHDA